MQNAIRGLGLCVDGVYHMATSCPNLDAYVVFDFICESTLIGHHPSDLSISIYLYLYFRKYKGLPGIYVRLD